MDEKIVWQTLKISPTKDESIIKTAYRKELVNNNPEDKPNEFQQLRMAYEMALAFAKMVDDKDKDKNNGNDNDDIAKSPLDIWLDKVTSIYACYKTRIDAECWRDILDDDICIGLDTSLEVCENL